MEQDGILQKFKKRKELKKDQQKRINRRKVSQRSIGMNSKNASPMSMAMSMTSNKSGISNCMADRTQSISMFKSMTSLRSVRENNEQAPKMATTVVSECALLEQLAEATEPSLQYSNTLTIDGCYTNERKSKQKKQIRRPKAVNESPDESELEFQTVKKRGYLSFFCLSCEVA